MIEIHKDKDIYFCCHLFSRPIRQKQYAIAPHLLWADLDEVDPRTCDIKPTIAIESSPGRFVGIWLVDEEIEEEINRDLTYYLGADHGGWDFTQVLRVPGTVNYKYTSNPRVRLLYDNGPTYKLRDIKRKLPQEEHEVILNASEVYEKYQRMLQPWVRRELLTQKVPVGKRSEMIWKLQHALLEAGLSKDETFTLIKASGWNKFKGRSSEDKQLRRELDKIVGERMQGGVEKSIIKQKYLACSMAEVEEQEIDWIWYPILARGEVSIIEGDPGLGKSYLTQMISKAICDAETLPSWGVSGAARGVNQPSKVAYFDMENSADTVTKKRLLSNGIKHIENFYQEEEPFSWADADRMAHVMEAIERIKPAVVVFDTMNTYLGGHVDTGRANSSQEAMFPLREIASRYHCAVIIIRHLVKAKKDKSALAAGQGSIAFAGFVRMVATVGHLPDDSEVCAFAVTKTNLASRPKHVLTYEIIRLPDKGNLRDRSLFKWGELVEGEADDIIQPSKKNAEKGECEEWLKKELNGHEVEFSKIERMAETRGFSKRTLYRAADKIEVNKETTGFGKNKKTTWSL